MTMRTATRMMTTMARRSQGSSMRMYCEPTKTEEAQKEVPTSKEDELTAHFRLPQKGDGPEKVVYDLAEKTLSLNVLQFRLFQKIINEAMGKSEMWEYDLVMNLSKGLASGGGGGGGGAFMMQPGMMQQAQAAAPVAAAEEAKEEEEAAPVEAKKEQTEFDVKLTQIDPEKKVKTIKVLKEVLKMPLRDAKEKIENLPSILAQNLSKEESAALVEALAGQGASASAV